MASDSVANVRFNVTETLRKIAPTVAQSAAVKLQIKPVLGKLNTDTNVDVKYFSAKTESIIACN